MSEDSADRIVRFYAEADEASRLGTGWFQLEHARTQELILRYLPPAPGTIVDAEGGSAFLELITDHCRLILDRHRADGDQVVPLVPHHQHEVHVAI